MGPTSDGDVASEDGKPHVPFEGNLDAARLPFNTLLTLHTLYSIGMRCIIIRHTFPR